MTAIRIDLAPVVPEGRAEEASSVPVRSPAMCEAPAPVQERPPEQRPDWQGQWRLLLYL